MSRYPPKCADEGFGVLVERRETVGRYIVLGASIIASFLAVRCGSDPVACDEAHPCAIEGDGSSVTDGGGDVIQPPPGCDSTADPKDAPNCVVDSYGVFVDATSGADTNTGTKESPFKTIGGALNQLAGKSRVYVCAGTYPEHVKLTTAVSIYGGFTCGNWTYDGTKPNVAPADVGYALELSSVSSATISDIHFESLAGTDTARSSIAAFANASTATLRRVELVAHDAHDGASATVGSNYANLQPTDSMIVGHNATAQTGGTEQTCAGLCMAGSSSTGGAGGNGDMATPTAGAPGKPDLGAGAGGAVGVCNPSVETGNPGLAGDDAVKPTTFGTLTEQGFAPADGPAGKVGGPGQGGGGGGGKMQMVLGAGGGGGCGGCGGSPGGVAQGGGASLALVSFESTLTFSASTLTAAKAGNGGAGAMGQTGQGGGNGGTPTSGGCLGGDGGKGGQGGASGGGAGGISAAVLYKGDKPSSDNTSTLTPGTKGDKGLGAVAGTNDGIDGQAIDILAVP